MSGAPSAVHRQADSQHPQTVGEWHSYWRTQGCALAHRGRISWVDAA